MSGAAPLDGPAVAVVGGGLAGLAAAVALAGAGCRVELFEARRALGGRATSFRDPASGEIIDHCQHVGMGCCTNLVDFCQRTEIAQLFRRDRTLHFIGPDGRQYRFTLSRWLPAPLHLARGFWGLKYLSAGDRLRIARAMWRLARTPAVDSSQGPTAAEWLVANGQSRRAIEQFWSVILVSALGESLDRASLAAARKVIVDGFMAATDASAIDVPVAPLGEVYGERLGAWLAAHGVQVHSSAAVRRVTVGDDSGVELTAGSRVTARYVVIAVPWTKAAELLDPATSAKLPWLAAASQLATAPITGVHLWFDRPITPLPHAVLVGRLSQWIFNRGWRAAADEEAGHYYQVVISASHELAGRSRDQIAAMVRNELAEIWPAAAVAKLLRARVVTDQAAVFSPAPGAEAKRPAQQTAVDGLYVAGDWTATGWPATMESAVRSGYLAAEAILRAAGRPQRILVPDLKRGWLARCLIRDV